MTPKFDARYEQALSSIGMTGDQAHVYELLLSRGSRQAGQIPRILGISRPQAYKLLAELVEMGVVTKETPPGKPAQFLPLHPFALQELIRRRQQEVSLASQTMEGVMGSLVSDFSANSKIPGMRVLPGYEGIQVLYDDVLREKLPIKLLRSVKDDDSPELLAMVMRQIEEQKKRGITTQLLGPQPTDVSTATLQERDASRLTTRRVLTRDQFSVPAQVLLFGTKVAITSYDESIMTTIIENTAIATTFSSIFELLWSNASIPT